jgi:hypothetical protein
MSSASARQRTLAMALAGRPSGLEPISSTKTRLNAPTAMRHDAHDDPMNTKNTPGIHREHRVIVVLEAW